MNEEQGQAQIAGSQIVNALNQMNGQLHSQGEHLENMSERLWQIEVALKALTEPPTAEDAPETTAEESPQEDAPPPTLPLYATNPMAHVDFMLQYAGRKESEPEMIELIEQWALDIIGYVPPAEDGDPVHRWCCTALSKSLQHAGYKYLPTLKASEYEDYGPKLEKPEKGCLIVYNKHINLCIDVLEDGTIEVVGGNQGDRMSKTTSNWYDDHMEFLGYYMPILEGEDTGAPVSV